MLRYPFRYYLRGDLCCFNSFLHLRDQCYCPELIYFVTHNFVEVLQRHVCAVFVRRLKLIGRIYFNSAFALRQRFTNVRTYLIEKSGNFASKRLELLRFDWWPSNLKRSRGCIDQLKRTLSFQNWILFLLNGDGLRIKRCVLHHAKHLLSRKLLKRLLDWNAFLNDSLHK